MDKGKGRAIDLDDVEHEDKVAPGSSFHAGLGKSYLDNLNAAQREAVKWNQQGGLQILAGPGSGKLVNSDQERCYVDLTAPSHTLV